MLLRYAGRPMSAASLLVREGSSLLRRQPRGYSLHTLASINVADVESQTHLLHPR